MKQLNSDLSFFRIQELNILLKKFIDKQDVSVGWANTVESLLLTSSKRDSMLDEFLDDLATYRPEGGHGLYNEKDMEQKCKNILLYLDKIK